MLSHQRKEYKLNGYPFKEFEKVGINLNLLYNLSRKGFTEKQVLNKAFVYKYGKPIVSKRNQFLNYYTQHLVRASKFKPNDRIEELRDIREDFFESGILFGFKVYELGNLWNKLTINHYFN